MSPHDEFQKFRELLEKTYTFPTRYPHKFIGRNTPEFLMAVEIFESEQEGLVKVSSNLSASEKHLALTYEFWASDPEAVVQMLRRTHRIADLIYVL